MRHTHNPTTVVIRDHRGNMETIDLADGTTEVRIPDRVDFTVYGGIPNHLHWMADDTKIGVFLLPSHCRRCC